MQDEEKRKILKMLISPNSERNTTKNINEFMSLADKTIKAAKSAENLSTSNQVNMVFSVSFLKIKWLFLLVSAEIQFLKISLVKI